jgi:Anti-sigma regulatory factor (Ser/Thr protein kinase)
MFGVTDEEVPPIESSVSDLPPQIDERLSGSLTAAAEARRKLEPFQSVLGSRRLEDVRLLVNEMVTNSLRHADALKTGIGLKVEATAGVLRVEVTDQGPGFDPEVSPPTAEQTSGRGLFLVQALSDRWGVIRSGGTMVWAEIDLR